MTLAQKVTSAVTKYRPALGRILERYGNLPLTQYAPTLFKEDGGATETFITVYRKRVSRLLGKEVADTVAIQLKQSSSVLTADHHSLLFHTTPFHGDVQCAFGARAHNFSTLPVLAFGNVPLNNNFYPRGVIWNGEQLPLFASKWRHASVFGMHAGEKEAFQKLPKEISEKLTDEVYHQRYFSDQITLVNRSLWNAAFSEVQGGMPELAYLQAEDVAIELLADAIERNSILSQVIFNKDLRLEALRLFDGIPGCWAQEKGSHFFWLRDEEGKMVPLRLEEERLISKNEEVIELVSENSIELLRQYRLVPTMFITFGALLLNGVRCLGGFQQSDYLAQMKSAWITLLQNAGSVNELAALEKVETVGYSTGPIFYLDKEQRAASLDTLLQDVKEQHRLVEGFERLTLSQANALGMVNVYKTVVPVVDREDELYETTVKAVLQSLLE